ncbi:hypothetical protein EG68_04729 [Paragonimus skrjabini miyazakii]|uniref:V-type proton ATPase subunit G n=1 Tax=Paragonimus skrjabini miyazakii TaxID=59628 RepID=A0A8S9Z3Y6_9TREM|nr:hypothetical protein EG68_04729 [Paragonimus skrjabini miyazakii]
MSSAVAPTDGVAQLQLARAAALAKVDEARIRRARRLKEAKDEAKAEIDHYKSIQDAHYNKLEEQVNDRQSGFEDSSRKATAEQLASIARSFDANKETALRLLMSSVLNVQPRCHKNFNPSF